MQLITYKLVPPSTIPVLSTSKAEKYVYHLGVKLCPAMDLVATYPLLTSKDPHQDSSEDAMAKTEADRTTQTYTDADENTISVDVWRFNGQHVFAIAVEDDDGAKIELLDVQWRDDGQIVAALSSDNVIRLVNTFTGKVIHRFSSVPTYAAPPSPTSPRTKRTSSRKAKANQYPSPSVLSYTTHFSDPKSTNALLHQAAAESSVALDDLLGLNADIASLLKSPANLPLELANIDVEAFLPQLSCLPPVGFGVEDVFSTRTSIDAIFHSSKKNVQSGNVDVLVAGDTDATVTTRIFSSFELGGVDLNSAAGMRKQARIGKIRNVTGCPFTSEIYVIAEDANKDSLHLLGLDLKFIAQTSNILPILATKATQLQNLLRYLVQIQTQLAREVKTAFDLPNRYLRNLNEDLEKQDGSGACFATAAYHALILGDVSATFKDWLNEQVGERGVKRWEKSVGDCLDLVRRLVGEAWCPAVERAGVVMSRLKGLAAWLARSDPGGLGSGLDPGLVEELQNTIDVMAICGEDCLRDIIKESSEFTTFMKWLKWEVEASALEDTSERLDEMREGSDHGDITKILEYIDRGPQESTAKMYFSIMPDSTKVDLAEDKTFYATFKQQRRKSSSGLGTPTFDHLLKRLRKQCDRFFEQIAHSLQKAIMTRYVGQLAPDIEDGIMDTRVVPSTSVDGRLDSFRLHLIARGKDDKTAALHQQIEINKNGTKMSSVAAQLHPLPGVSEILDLKFVDDDYLMVLVEGSDTVQIYGRRIEALPQDGWELRHSFKDGLMDAGMKPARLEINGRKKRRVVGVVDGEGKGFAVFDLDSGDTESGNEAEDGSMAT